MSVKPKPGDEFVWMEASPGAMDHPGKELRRLRKKKGWTQEECAQRLNVCRISVNQLENARRTVTADMARMLARTFPGHAALDWLIMQAKYDLHQSEHDARD